MSVLAGAVPAAWKAAETAEAVDSHAAAAGAATTPAILAAEGLRVQRGTRVTLDVPRLDLIAGELLALLGPNGAGKSTLLRCLALLERPEAGTVSFRGRALAWRDALAYRRRTATLLQVPALLDTSVFDNVAIGLRLRGVPRQDIRTRVEVWLERLGVAHLASRSARTLSGGEARRVSLARALVLDPEILFLDEPCGGLDAPARASLIEQLATILDEQRLTAILVTHDQAEAQALADRVGVMLDGRVRELGPVDAVLEAPADPSVAAFLQQVRLPRRRDRR